MSTERTRWTTDDFADLSWHDCHVHGFQIVTDETEASGSADLLLDIDYILEWRKGETGIEFVIAQATLRFHAVFGLTVSLDYALKGAGMGAFAIRGISRERETHANGFSSYRWTLPIDWPAGHIAFTSPGFTQTLVGPRHTVASQRLPSALRRAAIATAE